MLSETEAGSWEESSQACGSQGANLTSVHSLSEVEMLLKLMANCKKRGAAQIQEVLFVLDAVGLHHLVTIFCVVWCVQFLGMLQKYGLVFGNLHHCRVWSGLMAHQ